MPKHIHETDSELVMHVECPHCGSSDANALYDDGHHYCFSCGTHTPAPKNEATVLFKGQGRDQTARKGSSKLLDLTYEAFPKRAITETTSRKFGYGSSKLKGDIVQVASYRSVKGDIPLQKTRNRAKEFSWRGQLKPKPQLFGQHLWTGKTSKRLVITEGELDAMSISQVQEHKWPVVSIPNGSDGAAKSLQRNIGFIDQFEQVILCFDMDDAGRKAVAECAEVIENGKTFVVELPMKDANEMLVAKKHKELISCLWNAQQYRLDGIVEASEVREKVLEKIPQGLPWPWEGMTKITKGRHRGRVYTFGAGTGVGKTDSMTQIIAHDFEHTEDKIGTIYLEQPVPETIKRIAGKVDKVKYHDPDCEYEDDDLANTVDGFKGRLYSYDSFGATDYETVKQAIRSLVLDCGCNHVYLDHLTALAAAEDDERKALDEIMADLSLLAKSLDIYLYVISHLATPDGTPHEEGGRVMLRHFRGSRAIGAWTHYAFGLERNQQHSNEDLRRTTIIRCLKDRVLGSGTGQKIAVKFDDETGYLNETNTPESIIEKAGASSYGFNTEEEEGGDDQDF